MKKIQILAMACGVAASGICGCEHILEIDEGGIPADGITINSLAVTDTVLMAVVTKAIPFNKAPGLFIIEKDYWEYERSADSAFIKQVQLPEAEVTAIVNESDAYPMHYNPETWCYVSDYRPQEGDRIRITASSGTMPVAEAEASVPPARRVELVDCKMVYSKNLPRRDQGKYVIDSGGRDTVAVVTLRFADPPGADYYRLKVRSIADSEDLKDGRERVTDVFTSDDDLFRDHRLNKPYGWWEAGFSNVFDGRMCEGQTRTVVVESRLRYGPNPRVEVELQSLTRDFYYYLKSCELYRITEQNDYSELVQIHSNVTGGWGIFGGIASDGGFVVRF